MMISQRSKALERVSSFLLEMADRSAWVRAPGVSAHVRAYDIADYLGLAVEDGEPRSDRAEARHAITFRSVRQVRICDRPALQELAEKMAEPAIPAPARGSTGAGQPVRDTPAVNLTFRGQPGCASPMRMRASVSLPSYGARSRQGRFLALVAHEMRGPLARLSSALQLLIRHIEQPQVVRQSTS